jgi:hypothetical protein
MYCDSFPTYVDKFPINFANAGQVETAADAFDIVSLRTERAIDEVSKVRSDGNQTPAVKEDKQVL